MVIRLTKETESIYLTNTKTACISLMSLCMHIAKKKGNNSTTVQSPWSILPATLRASNPQIVNHWYRKSITILHFWPWHPVFPLLYGSGTVCKSGYPSSWPHFPCGRHDFLPLHCVFLYARIFLDRITHSPMPGKWHLVWHSSKLYK